MSPALSETLWADAQERTAVRPSASLVPQSSTRAALDHLQVTGESATQTTATQTARLRAGGGWPDGKVEQTRLFAPVGSDREGHGSARSARLKTRMGAGDVI